jgi:hypothetical protein
LIADALAAEDAAAEQAAAVGDAQPDAPAVIAGGPGGAAPPGDAIEALRLNIHDIDIYHSV